jgi:secreted PhoX family phosphatase
MNGEEIGAEGRGIGFVVTGPGAGNAYDLPATGKFSWENSVASPFAQTKTIVAGLDDSAPGQVYFYVGTKTNTGNDVERAGLTNGSLFGVKLNGVGAGLAGEGTATTGGNFTMFNFGDVTNTTGAALQTNSVANAVTEFGRPEDGHWDPNNPNDFYFVTTGQTSNASRNAAPTRLWRLRFTDISQPELGGSAEVLLDASAINSGASNTSASFPIQSLDNMVVTADGTVLIQEDPGNNSRLARTWEYDIATDALTEVLTANPSYFLTGGPNFLTQDEESSGIIDISEIMGIDTANSDERYYLASYQIHSLTGVPTGIQAEVVEDGQFYAIRVIPEPASVGLLAFGAAATLLARRRRN